MSNSSDGGEAILEGMRALGVDWIFSSPGSPDRAEPNEERNDADQRGQDSTSNKQRQC